jgi:hypothetical protein
LRLKEKQSTVNTSLPKQETVDCGWQQREYGGDAVSVKRLLLQLPVLQELNKFFQLVK